MNKKVKISSLLFIWVLVTLILMPVLIRSRSSSTVPTTRESFLEEATLAVNEDRVGAKVTLKEAIHGTAGITYRYIVKTDCPSWDYETRYMTKEPISWAVDDTAAVEVLIYDAQVRYNGAVYASDTYYTIPLFDNLSSEPVPLDEWKEDLMDQAYAFYQTTTDGATRQIIFSGYVSFTLVVLILSAIWAIKRRSHG